MRGGIFRDSRIHLTADTARLEDRLFALDTPVFCSSMCLLVNIQDKLT